MRRECLTLFGCVSLRQGGRMLATTLSIVAIGLSALSLFLAYRYQRTRVRVRTVLYLTGPGDEWRMGVLLLNRSAHDVRVADVSLRCAGGTGWQGIQPPDVAGVPIVIPARGRVRVDIGPLWHGTSKSPPATKWRYLAEQPCFGWAELEDGTIRYSRPGWDLQSDRGLPPPSRFERRLVHVTIPASGDQPRHDEDVVFRSVLAWPSAWWHRLRFWRLYRRPQM